MGAVRHGSTHLLLIDGDHTAAEHYRTKLDSLGYEVLVAGTGAEAITHCEGRSPDLVIVATSLPDTDGFSLIKELARSCDPIPRFVMLGDTADFDLVERAMALGAQDFLIRGENTADDLADGIGSWLGPSNRRHLHIAE